MSAPPMAFTKLSRAGLRTLCLGLVSQAAAGGLTSEQIAGAIWTVYPSTPQADIDEMLGRLYLDGEITRTSLAEPWRRVQ